MVLEAVVIGLLCYIANIGVPWFIGNTGGYYYLSRPLISGAILGFILGDLQTGIIIGAALQTVYISHVIAAGGTSADLTFVAWPATALAILSGAQTEVAIALAATIGVLGIFLLNAQLTTNIFWLHVADKELEKGNYRGYCLASIGLTQITNFLFRFVPTFLAVYFGATYAEGFLRSFPEWLLSSMTVLGGLLPALGIALLLASIMDGMDKVLFFILGFTLISVMNINLLVLTVIAVFIALIYYKFMPDDASVKTESVSAGSLENMDVTQKIGKKELRRIFWRWIFFCQSAMNSERLQGSMFGFALVPLFRRYTKNDAELCEAIKNENTFFDIENQMGSVIPGIVTGLEEARFQKAPISSDVISSVKTSLMGALAGVLATLLLGVIMPLLLSISVSLSAGGSIIGPLFYTVTFIPGILILSGFLFRRGYNIGGSAVGFLTGPKAKKIAEALTLMGIVAMGGLAAANVHCDIAAVIPTSGDPIVIQDLLKSVFPNLLPLLVTIVSWKLLKDKKANALILLGAYVIIAIAGVFLDIF